MPSSNLPSAPVVGHFIESTSSTTASPSSESSSTLPPAPLVSKVAQARGRERNRAFSPVRVGAGVKGLFGKKVSTDASIVVEELKVIEEEIQNDQKKVELVHTPLVEPALAPPPLPQQLVLTPESIVDQQVSFDKISKNSPESSSFSPVEISLQIKTMLTSLFDDSELAPPDQSRLLALLGRPEVMNGGNGKEEDEPSGMSSVWKCLEHASHDSFCSIMVSCDLDFSTTPEVTLASWMDFGGSVDPTLQASSSSGGWLPSWPWGKKQPPVVPLPMEGGGGEKVVRVWYPSKTKMSLHATWWGFSIYLPPPMMLVLDDGQVGTLKRISALTQGLSYLIKFLPGLLDLGPGMLLALALLGSLVPMISFIASFIAWSWTTIKSYDKGKGVILSATWLCPLLLITRSWDAPSPPDSLLAAQSDEKVALDSVSELEPPLLVVEEVKVAA